jgi:hypothetical protein
VQTSKKAASTGQLNIKAELAAYTPAQMLTLLHECQEPERRYLLEQLEEPLRSALAAALEPDVNSATHDTEPAVLPRITNFPVGQD